MPGRCQQFGDPRLSNVVEQPQRNDQTGLRDEDDDNVPLFTNSQADGGPEVGNLQDKQYHRSCYADEVQYGQGKKTPQ